ncbi:hypothetical protein PssiTeo3_44190 [Pseudomonas sichuanensis]|nr:hypothetical protein [Pseudomonas sichuanensis]
MKNHRPYLVRGILRLIVGVLAVGLAALAFNVAGYHLIQHDLAIIGEPSNWPSSYLGRALLLSFVGLIHFAVCIFTVALGAVVLFLVYYGILYAGGYREAKAGAC